MSVSRLLVAGVLLLSPLLGPLPGCIAGEIRDNALAMRHVSFIAMIEPVISQVQSQLPLLQPAALTE